MNLEEYMVKSGRTSVQFENRHEWAMMIALGLFGEFGEVCDLVKKVQYHGHTMDTVRMIDELGDLLWYVSESARFHDVLINDDDIEYIGGGNLTTLIMELGIQVLKLAGGYCFAIGQALGLIQAIASVHGASLSDVMDCQIKKQERRYKDGFSFEASINREV